jgi:hypothetical protein
MQKVKKHIPQKLKEGIPLTTRSGHKVRLEVTDEPLTVHTGLSLYYAIWKYSSWCKSSGISSKTAQEDTIGYSEDIYQK